MFKRPLCGLAVGLILGILYGKNEKVYYMLAVIFISVIMIASFFKRKIYWRGLLQSLLLLSFFFVGAWRYESEISVRNQYQSELEDEMELTIQGELLEKEYKNQQYIYYLKDCIAAFSSGKLPCNQIMVYIDTDEASIGEILVLNGKVKKWNNAVNEGNFDEESFYHGQKIAFKMKEIRITGRYGKPSLFGEQLFLLREDIKKVFLSYMNETDSGILTTMTLGDKSLLDSETKLLYQRSGISHVLAISGLHISVIGMLLYGILRKLRLSFWEAGILVGALMMTYGVMTGSGVSTKRAVLMFLVMLVGSAIGRSYDTLSALGLSAIVLLWENPFLLEYAGFLFSFAAVIGVVLLGKTTIMQLEKKSGLTQTLWMGLSIQLMTLPLTAYFYYEVPVYGILLNLFVLPLLGILLGFGLLGGLLGIKLPMVAHLLLKPCHVILLVYQKLCEFFDQLPYANWITGKPKEGQLIFYYSLLFAVVLGMKYFNCKEEISGNKSLRKVQRKTKKNIRRKQYFLALPVIVLALIFTRQQKGFELAVLDVGQGDGSFLQTESGVCLFVDGGSTDVSKVGTYRILPFLKAKGIRKMDYWIVSHTDKDHISGLLEAIEAGYPIENLVVSAYIVVDDAYEDLLQLAQNHAMNVIHMKKGDKIRMPEATLTCLFPDETYDSSDKNAKSLVVSYEDAEFTGIFTGDIGIEEEGYMVERGMVSDLIFLKAAHHGSKGSNAKEWLEVCLPEITTISCGRKNRYGHPGKEAVERMEACGTEIFSTAVSGEIIIQKEKNYIKVQKYLQPLDVFYVPMLE